MVLSTNLLVFSVVLLFFGFTPIQGQNDMDKLQNYYAQKCYTNSKNAATYDRLKANAQEFLNYVQYTFTFLPTEKNRFCQMERPVLSKRIRLLLTDLKACLPKEEYFLPGFLHRSFDEALHFLCHHHGENIDNFFSSQGKECRQKIETGENKIENCFGKIFGPSQGYVKQEELCDAYNVARRCFNTILDDRCPNFTAFKDLNTKFFDYVRAPCAGCTFYVNHLLLFLLVFVSLYNKMF